MPNRTIVDKAVTTFFEDKSEHAILLFNHFIDRYKKVGLITLYPTKTMIGIASTHKRIAYVTQIGQNLFTLYSRLKTLSRQSLFSENSTSTW